ncbi:unnamed protein product [Phytophthora fragariaefolia]|uniref:Unnamed protein product n=1 Tax=Phytophthora fragariaefolia TaxID=1490495 RepID=A0A9W6YNK0_9STRA|nr:unnamed protein product [Phytophthora fragariaefolia]
MSAPTTSLLLPYPSLSVGLVLPDAHVSKLVAEAKKLGYRGPDTQLRVFKGCFTANVDSEALVAHSSGVLCLFIDDLIHIGMHYPSMSHQPHCHLTYEGKVGHTMLTLFKGSSGPQRLPILRRQDDQVIKIPASPFLLRPEPQGSGERLKRKRKNEAGKFTRPICKTLKLQGSVQAHKIREHS